MIYILRAQNNKTSFFYVLYSDKYGFFTSLLFLPAPTNCPWVSEDEDTPDIWENSKEM